MAGLFFIAMIASVRGSKALFSHNFQAPLRESQAERRMLSKTSFPSFSDITYWLPFIFSTCWFEMHWVLFNLCRSTDVRDGVCAPWTLLEELDVWGFLSKSLCGLVFECQRNCSEDKTSNKQREPFGTSNGIVCLVWPFEDKRVSPCWAFDQIL